MKSNKGITLVSLLIYVIALSIVIGVIATFTRYFYRNTKDVTVSINASQKYTRVIQYITEDANDVNLNDVNVNTDNLSFYMSDGRVHSYFWINKCIYYVEWLSNGEKKTQIKLCNGVDDFSLEQDLETDEKCQSKSKITLNVVIENVEYVNIFVIK